MRNSDQSIHDTSLILITLWLGFASAFTVWLGILRLKSYRFVPGEKLLNRVWYLLAGVSILSLVGMILCPILAWIFRFKEALHPLCLCIYPGNTILSEVRPQS